MGLRIQEANTGGVGAVCSEQGCAVVTRTDLDSVTSGKRGRRGWGDGVTEEGTWAGLWDMGWVRMGKKRDKRKRREVGFGEKRNRGRKGVCSEGEGNSIEV